MPIQRFYGLHKRHNQITIYHRFVAIPVGLHANRKRIDNKMKDFIICVSGPVSGRCRLIMSLFHTWNILTKAYSKNKQNQHQHNFISIQVFPDWRQNLVTVIKSRFITSSVLTIYSLQSTCISLNKTRGEVKMKTDWCYITITGSLRIKIDIEDRDRVLGRKWHVASRGRNRIKVYSGQRVNGKSRQISLARFITNCPDTKFVCIWQDRLDFRKKNLVICNHSDKQHHFQITKAKTKKNHTSRFVGVSWDRDVQKWRAAIYKNGLSQYLGIYDDEEEAALVYQIHAEAYFQLENKKAA